MVRTFSKRLLIAALLLVVSGAASAALIGAQPDVRSSESSLETLLYPETLFAVVPDFARLTWGDVGGVAGAAAWHADGLNALVLSIPFEEYPASLVPGD